MQIRLNAKDALIVVDVQADFLPGGALPVANGEKVIQPLNDYIRLFSQKGLPVIFTRDWHCRDHCSFRQNGGQWPSHCQADTPGALFPPDLFLPTENRHIISKGEQSDQEAYSGFQDTGLLTLLREHGIRRVFVGGVATEYCVKATVLDALDAGLTTVLLTDAIQGVALQAGDVEKSVEQMLDAGAFALSGEAFSSNIAV